MIIAGNSFGYEPKWKLDEKQIENVYNIKILGMLFKATNNKHAEKRVENCRRSFL